LDCYFDPNERKYYITPQSVDRAIEEEKSKSKAGELPHASESFGNIPHPSESFRTVPNVSEPTANDQPKHEQTEAENLPHDLAEELEELRVEKRVWERERKFYDAWFASLEKERSNFIPQIAELSKSVGFLEAKTESLEKENQRLLATPTQNKPHVEEKDAEHRSNVVYVTPDNTMEKENDEQMRNVS
jgi:hypothetical protein